MNVIMYCNIFGLYVYFVCFEMCICNWILSSILYVYYGVDIYFANARVSVCVHLSCCLLLILVIVYISGGVVSSRLSESVSAGGVGVVGSTSAFGNSVGVSERTSMFSGTASSKSGLPSDGLRSSSVSTTGAGLVSATTGELVFV